MTEIELKIGCHLSISKGFEAAGKDAIKINANTFQYFTRNPRGGKAKDIDEKDVYKFLELAGEHDITTIIAHAPYTLNPCSVNENTREFARMVMKEDLLRTEYLPYSFYNFHPGSHMGQGVEAGIELIAGVDEAGRGPLAGPVVAAAVILPKGIFIEKLNDSKKLSPQKGRKLFRGTTFIPVYFH